MPDVQRAVAHLEDAEATIMSWWQRIEDTPDDANDEDYPPISIMLAAALRSVSRAAGALEADIVSSDVTLARDGVGRICSITYEGQTFLPNVRGPFCRADEYLTDEKGSPDA